MKQCRAVAAAARWAAALAALAAGLAGADVCEKLPPPAYAPEGVHPVTALASFQGSGNTWMRLLLAQLTGIKVGDTYHSYGNDQIPEFSSRSDSTVVAVKTHQYDVMLNTKGGNNPYERAIVIIRHPLNSLLAEFHRLYGGNKTGYANSSFFFNPDGSTTWKWDVWLSRLTVWAEFHQYWINMYTRPLHVISYNGLKSDMPRELSALAEFLGIPLDSMRLACTLSHHSNLFARDRSKARLSPEQVKLLFALTVDRANDEVFKVQESIKKRWGENSTVYRHLDLSATYL